MGKKNTNIEVAAKVVKVIPKNDGQKLALKTIDENTITIIEGSAGTGKSHCAVAYGLQMFLRNKYERLIFTRPIVEAGENIGFLPGDLRSKTDVYYWPIFDILKNFISWEEINDLIDYEKIILLPLAYIRGYTMKNAFAVLDEAQNATQMQLKLFLTRIGEGSKIVVTGDITQSDIGRQSGLEDAIDRLEGVKNLGVVRLTEDCIVRDPIVVDILQRYNE